jgi:hypothetical protein
VEKTFVVVEAKQHRRDTFPARLVAEPTDRNTGPTLLLTERLRATCLSRSGRVAGRAGGVVLQLSLWLQRSEGAARRIAMETLDERTKGRETARSCIMPNTG